jgi:DNA-binding response OmpR family regulator
MVETLLLIEDEPMVLALLRRGFEQHAYQVQTARDGLEGLALAQAQPPAWET